MNGIRTLYTDMQLRERVTAIAGEINRTLPPGELDVIGILKGSFVFLSDLVRQIERPCRIDFLRVASYGAARTSSGEIRLLTDISLNISGRRVLIVEDIVDSGMSLKYIRSHLMGKSPESLWTAALLFKATAPDSGELRKLIDFVGFELEGNPFVVGYGMDDNEQYRNLPFIGVADD